MKSRRKYAGFYEGDTKELKESGVFQDFVDANASELQLTNVQRPEKSHESPDFLSNDPQGKRIGIEVTEIVSEKAIRINQEVDDKWKSVYCDWPESAVVKEIRTILCKKDKKKYVGGPFEKLIVVIYTDEPTIQFEKYGSVLPSGKFGPLNQITDAYFLFSYDPSVKCSPCVKLQL